MKSAGKRFYPSGRGGHKVWEIRKYFPNFGREEKPLSRAYRQTMQPKTKLERRKSRGLCGHMSRDITWSGRQDLNLRLPAPKAGALPSCATPRQFYFLTFYRLHCFSRLPLTRSESQLRV